jgi:hypothetical protein
VHRVVELRLDRGRQFAERLASPVEPRQRNGRAASKLGPDPFEVRSPPERMFLVNASGGKKPPSLASWMAGYLRPPDEMAASTSRLVKSWA